tara:strand:- start:172127 stop:173302 length:1176 start_codon:yes stop_codon:yes gene_type:complete
LTSAFIFVLPAHGETWSDSTGKFQVEAEFAGVSGTNVVLKKADGSTLNVPIAKLSSTSRELAKQLYEQQKSRSSQPSPDSSVQQASVSIPSASSSLKLSVAPPVVSPVDPMPAFPPDATLQQTVDFVTDQLIAGHPEILWHMLPSEMRDAIDDAEIRGRAQAFLQEQAAAGKQQEEVMIKAIELLISKKDFILNSQLMSQVPPQFLPIIQQAYDPAVGLVYELMQMSHGLEDMQSRTITELLDQHGPRIGGHAKRLIALAPPQMIDSIRGSIVVSELDGTRGTVTSTGPDGKKQSIPFVRYGDRWIPQPLADAWAENKDDLGEKLSEGVEMANEQSAQSMMMAAMVVGMVNSVLDPLSKASTQEEFDAALMQATQMATSMQAGALPGNAAP